MELPKNIVQIGNPDKHYKVFVEDYVISYIKQVNRGLKGGRAGVALFGKKYAEDEQHYYFLYGASEIKGLENRGAYLSEIEKEQIEYKREEFFEEGEFLAWCTLEGEMPDGFYLQDRGKGVLINGYATFFEKNDNMLNFMIIMGNRENERTDLEQGNGGLGKSRPDYDWGRLAEGGNIEHRLLERNAKFSEIKKRRVDKYERNGSWKNLLTGAAVMLCVIGIAILSDEEKVEDIQAAARQIIAGLSEKNLPDAGEYGSNDAEGQWESLTEDFVRETETQVEIQSEVQTQEAESEIQTQPQETVPSESIMPPESETPPETQVEQQQAESTAPDAEVETVGRTVTYVVEKGDMLLTICRERYGSDERLKEVCELNGIEDPDDIKVGQIILLPE